MLREITTTVIDCDGCSKVFADTTDMLAEEIEYHANRDGWLIDYDNDRHLCPSCRDTRTKHEVATDKADAKRM